MKIKVSDATPPQIDCLVAKCEGWTITTASDKQGKYLWLVMGDRDMGLKQYRPSTNWMQGGPIIEREGVDILKLKPRYKEEDNRGWRAYHTPTPKARTHTYAEGPTPLIAAMRCYVASKLGDEVDVPEELKAIT